MSIMSNRCLLFYNKELYGKIHNQYLVHYPTNTITGLV